MKRDTSFHRMTSLSLLFALVVALLCLSAARADGVSAGVPPVGPLVYDSQVVDDDNAGNSTGNGDGIINAGETVELYVDLHNLSLNTAVAVQACLSADSPYVVFIFNICSSYGDIPGGASATNADDFDFSVNPSAPDGHVITFTLTISASNGGPWADTFAGVVGDAIPPGTAVALISDQSELTAITPILDDLGVSYDVLNNNWDGAHGVFTSNADLLSSYDVVIWYASGATWGRETTPQEHDALEAYLQMGGRLLVTGYDTLGSPTDALLADIVRSSSSGDGPFTYDYTVTNGSHPIMHGPFGSFPNGTVLVAGDYDHDQAEADLGRGAVTVAELTGGRDKILATELASRGRVVYWNGNFNVRDWVGQVTAAPVAAGQQSAAEGKDRSGVLANEQLVAQADLLDPSQVPPEANYAGDGPALHLGDAALAAASVEAAALAEAGTAFPATGDTVAIQSNPYWWHEGDYAQGVRTLSLDSVEHVDFTLVIANNTLNGAGHVDFDLSVNGIVAGSFTVLPGELVKNVSIGFPAIAGPTYTIRLEETNTVDPGLGSISLPLDSSALVLSTSQPEILKNTIAWLSQFQGDKHEPNENPASCTAVAFGQPIENATIDPAGDYDYYCFPGLAGQHIAADVDASQVGSALDPVLTLFATDGSTMLAENDDFHGLDSYLEYTLPANGTFYLRVRSYAHPCCGGPDHYYSLLLTSFKQPPPGDTDADGCADEQENGPNEALGGRRDYLNFWDFFDVPTGAGFARDEAVTGQDIFAVIGRFGAIDTGPGDFYRYSDPFSTPNPVVIGAYRANYHPAYDRGPLVGPDPWDLGAANGSITGQDIFAVIVQFGHNCW